MADAKPVSSPLVSDGGAASTIPLSTTEGTTSALTTTGGESVSIEETPETRALAQGPYNYPISPLLLLTQAYYVDSGVLLCRYEPSL